MKRSHKTEARLCVPLSSSSARLRANKGVTWPWGGACPTLCFQDLKGSFFRVLFSLPRPRLPHSPYPPAAPLPSPNPEQNQIVESLFTDPWVYRLSDETHAAAGLLKGRGGVRAPPYHRKVPLPPRHEAVTLPRRSNTGHSQLIPGKGRERGMEGWKR